MIIDAIRDKAAFNAQKFNGVELVSTPKSKTMVVCFEPGQAIPVHHPAADITLIILEGRAHLVGEGEELPDAGPGAVLISGVGEARGIKAAERTIALVVVSPPPTQEDHREIFEHMKKGTWR